jgi:hypothetical protein
VQNGDIVYLKAPLVWRTVWRAFTRPGDDLRAVPRLIWKRIAVHTVDFDWLAKELFERRLIGSYFEPDDAE